MRLLTQWLLTSEMLLTRSICSESVRTMLQGLVGAHADGRAGGDALHANG